MKEEESSDDAWRYYSPITNSENYEHTSQIENDVNSNYNPYLEVSRIFETRAGTNYDDTIQTNQEWFEEQGTIQGKEVQVTWNSLQETPNMKFLNVRGIQHLKAFGGITRDLSSFREETNKTTDLHQHLSRISTQKLETASQITCDAVTTHTKTASQDLKTASECTTQPII
ncbi:hypothetical protein Tco_0699792 [Tanacetum coccineum]